MPKTSADFLPQNPEVARSSRWTSTKWCQISVKGAGCPAHPQEEVPHFSLPAQIFACLIFLVVVLFCVVVFVVFSGVDSLKLAPHMEPLLLLQVFKSQINTLIENIECLLSWGREELL